MERNLKEAQQESEPRKLVMVKMDSKKVKNRIGPVLVISVFIATSYFISSFFENMAWRDIMTLGIIEVLCFYAVKRSGFGLNRTRILCTILALQIVFYSFPYMGSAWIFERFRFDAAYSVYDVLYDAYDVMSVVVAILLLTISVWPERSLDEFSDFIRADFYLSRVNNYFGANIFSVKRDVQWKR